MQTGDLRRAGVELRRVVDEAPRDSRRSARWRSCSIGRAIRPGAARCSIAPFGLHRQDLGRRRGGVQLETLRALASLLALARAPPRGAGRGSAGGRASAAGRRRASGPRRGPGGAWRRSAAPRSTIGSFRQTRSPRDPAAPAAARAAAPPERTGAGAAPRPPRRHARPTAGRAARRPGRCSTPSRLSWASATSTSTSRRVAASAGPIPLRAEPGSPPAIIIGAPIEELGPAALRFAAARALRLTSTNLDAILAVLARGGGRAAGRDHPAVRPRLRARRGARRT